MRMRRRPCCDKIGLKKGPWSSDEDELLVQYITKNGPGSWRSLPKLAGLLRCGKSCRLRWINYLRPDINRGPFSLEEEKLVIQLHAMFGNRWAAIAAKLPGRTDNEIKNLWNTHLKKRLLSMGVDPQTHKPCTISVNWPPTRPPASLSTHHMAQWESTRLKAESRLSKDSLILSSTSTEKIDTDYFLRIWNSEVGQSFRNFNKEGDSQSPISQPSSSTKNGSFSGTTMGVGPTVAASQNGDAENKCSKSCTDYSSSDDLEDSSDTALQLLLDSPGSNDMSFLEGDIDNYDIYSGILTESFPLKNGRPYC